MLQYWRLASFNHRCPRFMVSRYISPPKDERLMCGIPAKLDHSQIADETGQISLVSCTQRATASSSGQQYQFDCRQHEPQASSEAMLACGVAGHEYFGNVHGTRKRPSRSSSPSYPPIQICSHVVRNIAEHVIQATDMPGQRALRTRVLEAQLPRASAKRLGRLQSAIVDITAPDALLPYVGD